MGLDRVKLRGMHFAVFVVLSDRLTFADFLVQVLPSNAKQVCELQLEVEHRFPLSQTQNSQIAPLSSGRSIPLVKGATILLVEDDDSVRQLVYTVLSSAG